MGGAALLAGTLGCFLAALFLRAVWHKARYFGPSTGFVAGYGILPPGLEALATRLLIATEAAVLAMLILPATRSVGAAGAALVLAGYALAMGVALGRGLRRIDCGCGGAPQVVSGLTIGRNLALAALALLLAALPTATIGGAAGAALALAGGLTLWSLHAIVERLIANAGHIGLASRRS